MKILSSALSSIPIVLAVAAWELVASWSDSGFVPHLPAVAQTIWQSAWQDNIIQAQGGGRYGYIPHVCATLQSFLVCLCGGAGAALVVTVSAFPWRPAKLVLAAAMKPWHVIPPLIAIPLMFAVFGAGWAVGLITGAFYAFISSSVYMLSAFEDVPQNFLSLARLGGAGRLWTAWKVLLPAILPMLVGPLKVVASFTLGVVVVLEYLALPQGIGRVMKFAVSYHSIELLLAGVFWATSIGLFFDACIDGAGRLLFRWAPRYVASVSPAGRATFLTR